VTTTHHRFAELSNLSACLRDTAGDATIVPGAPRQLPEKSAAGTVVFADIEGGLKSILEYTRSDQVISVECGITCGELQELLKSKRHWLPVTAGDARSLLDVIVTGDAGELEHGFGGPRDLVLGLTVMLADGSTIKTGGKVVKNVTGYDTTKLFVGSHGWFGIPVAAHLRLYARTESERTLLFAFTSIDDAFAAAQRLLKLGLPLSSCELFSVPQLKQLLVTPHTLGEGATCCLALRIHGHHQVVAEIAADAAQSVGSPALPDAWPDAATASIWSARHEDTGDSQVAITLPIGTMRQVLKDPALGATAWQSRPWRGRLTFYCSASAAGTIVTRLKSVTARLKVGASVAYPTDAHWLTVERLPERDTAADLIKDELKKRFDPTGKLNRLVRL
jgi:FAD/FMN-containing dehydrogenase